MRPPAFTPLLRRALWSSVEFSISDTLASLSTMIPATSTLLDEIEPWAGTFHFCEPWLTAVRRVMVHVAPDAMLFRIDWSGENPVAFTWYFRFPNPPDAACFEATMRCARPFQWVGPAPTILAAALNLAGPQGIGLRVDSYGNCRTAIYFRVRRLGQSTEWVGGRLLAACGLPRRHSELIAADLMLLGPSTEIPVIGIDQGSNVASVGALKVDPGDVPVVAALHCLANKDVSIEARLRVESYAASLHARTLSYLGLAYAQEGLKGWRAYFSSEPGRMGYASTVPIASHVPTRATQRLPQY